MLPKKKKKSSRAVTKVEDLTACHNSDLAQPKNNNNNNKAKITVLGKIITLVEAGLDRRQWAEQVKTS